ncbi:MAG: hypothetical protein HN411_02710 [Waddliaceae bacterium]|jgi:hypothetical protein|nr:hypothetical protein [Waddliaceae bacterium]MBT3578675.1 hypothetical protein [Waddliaceae bacterium]MBT4445394.1 hypothetical protein [Waddliaceae bacterium]MBT6928338.1 hypothetical protein [Waddliaceae bacterium]MBT7265024.1 hypothetical protein [Waddliaceae bacterium]
MEAPTNLKASYHECLESLSHMAPDDIISVDLELLHSLDLVDQLILHNRRPSEFNAMFHIIESSEKITLFNERFLIWLVPQYVEDCPVTFVMIASNTEGSPNSLEMVFSTSGIYNSSFLILRILEKLLFDIKENDVIFSSL